ncbi:MAG: class I SAM-dependent methyltransferase [Pseudomonadota bacterium]
MPDSHAGTALICEAPNRRQWALDLAEHLNIPFPTDASGYELVLAVTAERLELRRSGEKTQGPVYVDFTSGMLRYRMQFGGGRKEPLARAVGLKSNRCPLVLDATAGLGRDSFMLASLGCRVIMMERSPVLAALLEDGLQRAAQIPELSDILVRITLTAADCLTLPPLSPPPDVIYLDPMYPHRTKTALVKKEMRLVRSLVGEDSDASELLDWALQHRTARVVVKRPKGAETLGSGKPSTVITSKNSRFDVYLPGTAKG